MGAADQGTEGSIYSSRPDGSDVACVVPTSGPIGTPKQLMLDPKRRQLYCVSLCTPRHKRLRFEQMVAAGQGDKQPDSAGVGRIRHDVGTAARVERGVVAVVAADIRAAVDGCAGIVRHVW